MTVIGQATIEVKPGVSGFLGELGKLSGPLGSIAREGEVATGKMSGGFGGVGIAIAAVGVAAIGFAVSSAEKFKQVGTEVLKLQRYTGDSAQSMSKLRFAAQESGVDTDKLAKSLGFLSKNLQSGKVDFSGYGIATVDASGKMLPLNTVLLNVAAKFQSMPNGVQKTAEAIKIFGKAGADMIPMLNKGKDGLLALESQAQKYGLVLTGSNLDAIKKSIAAHREQTAAMQGLQVQIGQNVLPIMTKLTTALTEGLVKVMPVISGIMNTLVVPALSAVAGVLTTVTSLISNHIGIVKMAAGVIGTVLVPMLVKWAITQAIVLAQNVASFVLGIAASAVRAASSLGLMTGSLEAGTAAMTFTGVAAGGLLVVLGLLITAYAQQGAAAQKAAHQIVESAASPQAGMDLLLAKQKDLSQQLADKGDVGRLWFVRQFDGAYALKVQLTGVNKEIAAQKAAIAQAAAAAGDASTSINDALTTQGIKIEALGGKTKLTTDQVEQLAASMNIDLTKASASATQKLVDQAQKLSYTKDSTLNLATANQTLGDWTKDVTQKTTAFKSALDALIGSQLSADQANIKYQQDIADLASKLVAGKHTFDENTQAGRDNKTAIDNAAQSAIANADAVYKQTNSMDAAKGVIADFVAHLTATLTAAGYTKDQINALVGQMNLLPSAIAQIDPPLAAATGAMDSAANAAAALSAQLDAAQNSTRGLANASAQAAAHGYSTGALPAPTAVGNYPKTGHAYAFGGTVSGPIGAPQVATVHGGELVLTPAQQAKLLNGQSTGQGVQLTQNIYPSPGMSETMVGRVAASEASWAFKNVSNAGRS